MSTPTEGHSVCPTSSPAAVSDEEGRVPAGLRRTTQPGHGEGRARRGPAAGRREGGLRGHCHHGCPHTVPNCDHNKQAQPPPDLRWRLAPPQAHLGLLGLGAPTDVLHPPPQRAPQPRADEEKEAQRGDASPTVTVSGPALGLRPPDAGTLQDLRPIVRRILGQPSHPAPLPQATLAFTSRCRPWAGPAGRARAARGTPGRPGPRSPPRRRGTAPPARCPWPPRRAAAGPPRHGAVWQGGAAQLGQGTSGQGSRDKGRLNTGHQTCLGFAASPGAPSALGKTRSFGTAGKAHLGGEAGVTAQPSPDWPVPDPQAHQP